MIFFDNASTTRVFDEVREKMDSIYSNDFFNPSALYGKALRVKNLVEESRQTIANQLGAEKGEIYFTSCATESNNWVLNCGIKNKKGNLVISKGEHASNYECAMNLKSKGYEIRFVNLNKNSTIDTEDLLNKIDENTALVSLIHCSNETGAINDISAISKLIKEKNKNALIHSDGVQAFCKLETFVKNLGVDFYTISGHKIGGPKGIGALYINKKINIQPFIVGGGQESNLRSGTENTPAIIGFKEAVDCYKKYYDKQNIRLIFNFILEELVKRGWIYNGDTISNSGFILSFSYEGIRGEILQHLLSEDDILIGLGSACSSKTSENRVLSNIGRKKKEIEGSTRISLSVFSTIEEARYVLERIDFYLNKLKNKAIG